MLLSRWAFSACSLAGTNNISSLVQPSLLQDLTLSSEDHRLDCVGTGLQPDSSVFLDDDVEPNFEIPYIYPLLKHFGPYRDVDYEPQGMSVATWVTLDPDSKGFKQLQPIISVNKPFSRRNWVQCPGYQLQIGVSKNKLEVTFGDEDEFRTCLYLDNIQLTPISHVVVTFSATKTSIFVNGQLYLEVATEFDISLENWFKAYGLSFFSSPHIPVDRRVFRGIIHQVDLFDEPLDEVAVWDLYQENYTMVVDDLNILVSPAKSTLLQLEPAVVTIQCDSILNLELHIVDFPLFGNLSLELANATNAPLDVDTVPFDSQISLLYTIVDPNHVTEDLFTYQIIGRWNGKVVKASQNIAHTITVDYTNHEPSLTVPVNAILDLYGYQKAVVQGVVYDDETDMGVSKALVHISATHNLTLFPVYKSLADFSCSACFDRHNAKAFLASPESVNGILRGLFYERPDNVDDSILIRIKGDPNCLETEDSCFVAEGTVRVKKWTAPVDSDAQFDAIKKKYKLYGRLTMMGVTFIVIFFIAVCLDCCCRRIARGGQLLALL